MYAELPYVAFVAAFLVLVPLPWHWRSGNVATLAMVAWLFVINVIYGVDAIIWSHNVKITALVWCDITGKIIIGAQMALPAACMCISIHLAQVASVARVQNTGADKRRRMIIELLLCFGIPLLWMGLHYLVQGHRFDIIEFYGCRPNTYISIPGILLLWVPPLIYSLVTLVFSAIALKYFLQHRITFARYLENSNSGLTASRYLRLMAMAFVEIIITTVSSSITLWFTSLSLRPWTNFADVHYDFSRVATLPIVFAPRTITSYYYVTWYIIPVSSLIFFVFFAFGQDAIREYSACFAWIRRHIFCCVRRKPAPLKDAKHSAGQFVSLPSASITTSDYMIHSLPSYQSAIGGDEVPILVEKDITYMERYAAEPIDRTDIFPAPLHHITAFSDGSSYASSSPISPSRSIAPSDSLSDSEASDLSPTLATHPHDLV
ncbi:pheromone A receptor-domain-containing protein [Ganoderma leucocontextum]|nr:pheromone A receptor-domain-containing protein [Ganoderma leucocontextum]